MQKGRETGDGGRSASNDDRVRLPAILGIQPGIYLFVIYGLIILGVLFLVCLYPGISRPGSIVSFQTEPWGAAIRIDGVYRGAAPEELFLDRGPHTVEFSLPGFESRRLELDIPGRAAFSLFFPRRLRAAEGLTTVDSPALIAAAAGDYAGWSFTGEASGTYQIPLSLSEGVYRGGPVLRGGEFAEAEELIRAAARFTASRGSFRDLSRAKFLLDNRGMAPSPLTLVRSAGDILAWLSSTPEAESWLAGFLPAEEAALVRDSAWTGGRAGGRTGPESLSGALIEAGGLRFRGLGRGSPVPYLYYCESAVDSAAWEAFIRDRPEWAPEDAADLQTRNLAAAGPEGGGVVRTGVSWHGALAFCRWLNGLLPPGFEGWEVRLPSEGEWEDAEGFFNSGGGDLWEWCSDPYAPFRSFPAGTEAAAAVSSPERVLRKRAAPRGSLPPEFSSPFTGFRPFLAPPGGNL
jgi:hypothetical protein